MIGHRWTLIAFSLLLPFVAAPASAEAFRLACQGMNGSRVQYFDNPLAPPAQNRRVIVHSDAITGVRVEITFATENTSATLVTFGNVNLGGAVTNVPLVRLPGGEFLSFVGRHDSGEINLLSFFPQLGRLLWTVHHDRIAFVDRGALGKIFIGECTMVKL